MKFLYVKKILFILPLFVFLAACGGSNGSHQHQHQHEEEHDHDHAHGTAGRLIYLLDDRDDTLQMFDQTLEHPGFAGTSVAAKAGAELVLSNDGLTIAMLEGTSLSVVSSGLEHMTGEHAHAHDVALVSAAPIVGVQQVVASGEYFSTLDSSGNSQLISSDDGSVVETWSGVVYPTLVLEGGDFLRFTENAADDSLTDISVVDHDGDTGVDGRIFVRPNDGGYLTTAITCANGVSGTAQTDSFTLVLCGDGSLRWLISGYEAPEGHPQAGKTLHVTQRYPATETRAEGAIGEVTGATASGFVRDITGLVATHHDGNVIAAWSADQLWLINAHGDHPHRADLAAMVGDDFGDIIAVAVTSDDNALAALSKSGKIAISRFDVENNNPVATGDAVRESLYSDADWTTDDARLLAGPNAFYVAVKRVSDGAVYALDFHDEGGAYHLHATHVDAGLKRVGSAVFAHLVESDHDHDHDHEP